MFDVLSSAESGVASEAAYRVVLRIYERQYFGDWRRWIHLRPNDTPQTEAVVVATRVLEEIECRAGKPLGSLSDAEVEPYRRRVHEIMRTRRVREFPDVDGTGARILRELRRDYGLPERRAVA